MINEQRWLDFIKKEAKSKDELFAEFKRTEMKIFKYLGLSQGICFGLMLLIPLLSIWTNWLLVIKLEATLFCLVVIIGIVYNYLDSSVRKQFDIAFKDYDPEGGVL